jgi:hypothetical protein
MRRHWKLLIAIVVVMLALTGVWVVTMCIEPSDDVEAYKKSLIAKGEKLTVAELLPPPVPPAQNGADVVKEAARLIVGINGDDYGTNLPLAMRLISPGRAAVGFLQPDIRADYFTNSWSNVLQVMEANRPAAEMLKRVLDCSALDFHLDYTDGQDMDLTCTMDIDNCAQLLSGTAICELHEGNTADAITNICVLLALANGEQNLRTTVSEGDRACLVSLAMSASWELLQSSNVDDAELRTLQKNWDELEFIHATENALLMCRAGMELAIQKARNSDGYFQTRGALAVPRVPPAVYVTPIISETWSK